MSKILITGGAGNIGSFLVAKLIDNNEVTVVDDLSHGKLSNLPPTGFRFIQADINTFKGFKEKFDYIFHLAAFVGVMETQKEPLKVFDDIDGIKNILNLAKEGDTKRVFFASSSEIYGESPIMPLHEDNTPLNCRLPYAVVKNIGESLCKSYYKKYGLNYTIFRFFNTFGSNQTTRLVIPKFIEAAKENKDIVVYGNGQQTRCFIFVDDTVDVCLKCLYENKMVNGIINIGSDKIYTILDLAKLVIKLCQSKSKIILLPSPVEEGDITYRQPDNTKMKYILNRELISLEEGIKKII